MDIKHILSCQGVPAAYDLDAPRTETKTPPGSVNWIAFDGGVVQVGVDPSAETFRFDNEEPRHDALVPGFEMADRLVTCQEWLEFIADGGYERAELWLSDGWHTKTANGWTAPLYWTAPESRADNSEWMVHTLAGTRPVALQEPVCHISFYEADAFASWSGSRLPTEIEWEHAATSTRTETGTLLIADDAVAAGSISGTNALHPQAVTPSSDATLVQMPGEVWQWTGSAYRPYPGYTAPPGAIGEYNGKFMVNTMVLRGGSAITPADHVRNTYRNFFHPHTRWHMSGLRLVRDAS